MPNVIDIDGTLVTASGQPRARVIAYVRRLEGTKYIVSGRPTSQRAAVEALMRGIGLDVDGIYLNPGVDTRTHKRAVAQRLNRQERIDTAVDNDPRARRIYRSLGIENVIDPDDIA